jgi:hypothetical protein
MGMDYIEDRCANCRNYLPDDFEKQLNWKRPAAVECRSCYRWICKQCMGFWYNLENLDDMYSALRCNDCKNLQK